MDNYAYTSGRQLGRVEHDILANAPDTQAQTVQVSVVIPAFNEVNTIGEVIRRVLDCGFESEVIVVDDASTDGTRDYLKQIEHPKVRCLFHTVNRGKGAALRTGFAAARHPFVLVQDADLEYDPRDFHLVLEPLVDGRADMVYGSRFLGGPHRVMFFWHYVGNRFLTLISNMTSDLNLSDMETGMKAFRRDKLMALTLRADRFTFDPRSPAKPRGRVGKYMKSPFHIQAGPTKRERRSD